MVVLHLSGNGRRDSPWAIPGSGQSGRVRQPRSKVMSKVMVCQCFVWTHPAVEVGHLGATVPTDNQEAAAA